MQGNQGVVLNGLKAFSYELQQVQYLLNSSINMHKFSNNQHEREDSNLSEPQMEGHMVQQHSIDNAIGQTSISSQQTSEQQQKHAGKDFGQLLNQFSNQKPPMKAKPAISSVKKDAQNPLLMDSASSKHTDQVHIENYKNQFAHPLPQTGYKDPF